MIINLVFNHLSILPCCSLSPSIICSYTIYAYLTTIWNSTYTRPFIQNLDRENTSFLICVVHMYTYTCTYMYMHVHNRSSQQVSVPLEWWHLYQHLKFWFFWGGGGKRKGKEVKISKIMRSSIYYTHLEISFTLSINSAALGFLFSVNALQGLFKKVQKSH